MDWRNITEAIHHLRDDNEVRDKGIKREFQNVYETIGRRFDVLDSQLRILTATFANSKVFHLSQKVHPLPVFDASNKNIETPRCFPSTAYEVYRLQEKGNWRKLGLLLAHYSLAEEAIRIIDHESNHSDSDSDSESNPDLGADKLAQLLPKAIESNPFLAMSIFGSHLGLDCNALHDRVQQLEFNRQQKSKRAADKSDDGRKQLVKRMLAKTDVDRPQARYDDSESSIDRRTQLNWEVDSSEFRRKTGDARIRDAPLYEMRSKQGLSSSPSNPEQRGSDVQVRSPRASDSLSSTEKVTSPSEKQSKRAGTDKG